MKFVTSHPKKIAFCFLLIMTVQLVAPTVSYALTSGPSQPEMQAFQSIGNTEMVDLFSGDFSYNIPLMDVGGYPVNLAYHSGASLDDEATWVGYGWNLNVGAVNRQLRGLPDDFNGSELQQRELNVKPHITTGARFSGELDLMGFVMPKIGNKANLSVSTTIRYDNYRGIGVDLGLNAGVSLTPYLAGDKTSASEDKFKLDAGLNLSSFDGAGLDLNASVVLSNLNKSDKIDITKSIGFGYNTREGLSGMTLKNSVKASNAQQRLSLETSASSFVSFNSPSYTPSVEHPTITEAHTFSLNGGVQIIPVFTSIGVTGFHTKQETIKNVSRSAYGYLYSERGRNNEAALMDLNREKDIPYTKEVSYLPIPVPSYDLFSATSQDGSGQYRAYRGSSGVYFDPATQSDSKALTVGLEFGAGLAFDGGVNIFNQQVKTRTGKWKDQNGFLSKADFQVSGTTPAYEPAYFKRVGEMVPADADYISRIKGSAPIATVLSTSVTSAGAQAYDQLVLPGAKPESSPVLSRQKREVRNTAFSHLTAIEAQRFALDLQIKDYHPDSLGVGDCSNNSIRTISRTSTAGYRRPHHISEIKITGDDGKISVYGIPVYNVKQEEISFSIGKAYGDRNKGLVPYNSADASISNKSGRENYYSKETTAAYATSYLLTGILSPDYIDKTGNGISDDDNGTAVKFNYTKLPSLFRWRTPYVQGSILSPTANYNEGLLSDDKDDKANLVYGEKEVWYMHSVESKTMVAHFILEDREDGLGVKNAGGEVDNSVRLKRLKEIRLYSKSDLKEHNNNPQATTPIKVVHFEYDYSICTGLPNSINGGGKLTLKKVWFTFGDNGKGKLSPYEFVYNTTNPYNQYEYRQYDRWGNFKPVAANPSGLNNSEFPYTIQNADSSNKYAAIGQMNGIRLPSGGTISVSYEADDYAYVQDKRASQMVLVKGTDLNGSSKGLIEADYIYVDLPVPVKERAVKETYFEGMEYLYFKFLLDLDANKTEPHKEFVPGYARIKHNDIIPVAWDDQNRVKTIKIGLEKLGGKNPIARAGWQFLRTQLPKYAYPNSQNIDQSGSNAGKVVNALLAASKTFFDLIRGYEGRAKDKKYSDEYTPGKSWVRLCAAKKKIGGGARVKRIDISDDWAAMSGTANAKTSVITQLYDYTTKDRDGSIISSGVASYEPMIGNDENPFRQPVPYKQKQFLGLNDYHYIEQPFCESFFPAASVGYSKVSVKSIGSGDAEDANRTGASVSEFYTARDYPVKVQVTPLQRPRHRPSPLLALIGVKTYDAVGLSQGYSVELNDMHGKPKSSAVYNQAGELVSRLDYFYKTANEAAELKELSSDVKLVDAAGDISDGQIGFDAETYTDMREQTVENKGINLKPSAGLAGLAFLGIGFIAPLWGSNEDTRSYRAASTIKIINRFGIQYKTKKIQNGSSITTENLLWDAETGNVLLTKTQNEFDDPLYSFAYPAHWVYNGMGQAYKNLGVVLAGFSTGTNGTVNNGTYNTLLVPGDELVELNSSRKYWVIRHQTATVNSIIDENGNTVQLSPRTLKLLRSGRRNMANAAIGTITSLVNPVKGNRLSIDVNTKVLDAKATEFSDEWSMPLQYGGGQGFSQCTISDACMEEFLFSAMSTGTPRAIYNTSNSFKVGDLMNADLTSCYASFLNGMAAPNVSFYQYHLDNNGQFQTGDSAQLGDSKLYFDLVAPTFHDLVARATMDSIRQGFYVPGCTTRKSLQLVSVPDGSHNYAVVQAPYYVANKTINRKTAAPPLQCISIDTILKFRLVCPPANCDVLTGFAFNPYNSGILGNWRPKKEYVYHVSRENLAGTSSPTSTNIRKSGAYSIFNPFWNTGAFNSWQITGAADPRWIAAREVTYFNSKGTEIENKDALGRYSSALFGYLESLPVAVASNAQYREIAYDGFEDYNFVTGCAATGCNRGHFDFRSQLSSSLSVSNVDAHTGKHSLLLNGTVSLSKTVFTTAAALFSMDATGAYRLGANELAKGFSPVPGKKYVLSFWIKDDNRHSASASVQASVNTVTSQVFSADKWPVVEGWKRVEVPFVLAANATSFTLHLTGANVYIDDIRIHPYDGQMKSFAYDASSQRLMAELDENNFATLYEYDDEGILVRVKKETDRGIMTIKETRSSYKKVQP